MLLFFFSGIGSKNEYEKPGGQAEPWKKCFILKENVTVDSGFAKILPNSEIDPPPFRVSFLS